MQRLAFVAFALGGCFTNPTVEVDKDVVEVPRGVSDDVLVSVDGEPVYDFEGLYWTIDDPRIATVTPMSDRYHLTIAGALEGITTVRIGSYGQILEIPVRVGPPAIARMWTEPADMKVPLGGEVLVRAKTIDTIGGIHDVTFDSKWTVRDSSVVQLDTAGMMLRAMDEGTTSLHVTTGHAYAVVPVSVFK